MKKIILVVVLLLAGTNVFAYDEDILNKLDINVIHKDGYYWLPPAFGDDLDWLVAVLMDAVIKDGLPRKISVQLTDLMTGDDRPMLVYDPPPKYFNYDHNRHYDVYLSFSETAYQQLVEIFNGLLDFGMEIDDIKKLIDFSYLKKPKTDE